MSPVMRMENDDNDDVDGDDTGGVGECDDDAGEATDLEKTYSKENVPLNGPKNLQSKPMEHHNGPMDHYSGPIEHSNAWAVVVIKTWPGAVSHQQGQGPSGIVIS